MADLENYTTRNAAGLASAEEKRINTARIAQLAKTHICSSEALKAFAKTHRPETYEDLQAIEAQWGVKWDKSQDALRMEKRKKGK